MTQGISRRWPRELAGLTVSGVAVTVVAAIGTAASINAADSYGRLQQPAWAPPAWLFGPMWTALYALMAVSAWLVWRSGSPEDNRTPLIVYGIQLVLNMAWTPLFFGLGWRGLAFIEILVLWGFIAATVLLFWQRNRWAAALLLPYVAWTTFAAVLNFSVWQLNN
ncbi:TspO/MBR family protein [Mycobacterium sp. NPDC050853]|uniref:TspO/MBR family protein n=1 Tax=Mycobacteriaceae TaxID=1762 RepID=UPI0015DF6C87|nr:tryptophan-rich sensory protein [Mycobacteroides sp. LB1]